MDVVEIFLNWIWTWPWIMKVKLFNKAEKLNNAQKLNNILTNSQSACMSVSQHLMTHITQEKTLNQTIIQICGSYNLCLV